jgi:hypothetical protein
VGKQWDSHTIKFELFFLGVKIKKPKYTRRELVFRQIPGLLLFHPASYPVGT